MEGRIKIHRKIDDRGRRKNPYDFSIFLYLLTNANIQDNIYQGHTIKRGDCIIGRKTLSEKLGITEQSIRTSLEHLKSTSEITIKSTNKFSVITVCKWEDYQIGNKNQPTKQPANQQTTNQQLTTLREEEERKEDIATEKTLDIPEHLLNNFNRFVEMRGSAKKHMTEYAKKLLISKVLKLGKTPELQNRLLEKSILHGRQGVFPLDERDMLDDPVIFKRYYDEGKYDQLKNTLGIEKFFELKKSLANN